MGEIYGALGLRYYLASVHTVPSGWAFRIVSREQIQATHTVTATGVATAVDADGVANLTEKITRDLDAQLARAKALTE